MLRRILFGLPSSNFAGGASFKIFPLEKCINDDNETMFLVGWKNAPETIVTGLPFVLPFILS